MSSLGYERDTISGSWPRRDMRPSDDDRSLMQLLAVGLSQLGRWLELRRSRRVLMGLSDETLRDIGVTRDQARAEADRSFYWDRNA